VGESARAPFIADVPGLSPEPLREQEDETLAQRAARIKLEKEKGAGGQFTEELTHELGLAPGAGLALPSKTPDGEETLAQRRKRLKEEASRNGPINSGNPPRLRSMHSLADVLQAHPVGLQNRQVSNESQGPAFASRDAQRPLTTFNQANPNVGYPVAQTVNWGSTQHNAAYANGSNGNLYPANAPYMNTMYGASNPAFFGAPMPMAPMQQPMVGFPYGLGNQPYAADPMMGPPLDPKQRAQIDHWRQSVVQ